MRHQQMQTPGRCQKRIKIGDVQDRDFASIPIQGFSLSDAAERPQPRALPFSKNRAAMQCTRHANARATDSGDSGVPQNVDSAVQLSFASANSRSNTRTKKWQPCSVIRPRGGRIAVSSPFLANGKWLVAALEPTRKFRWRMGHQSHRRRPEPSQSATGGRR